MRSGARSASSLIAASAASVLFAIPLLALLRWALGVKAPPRRQFPLPEPVTGGRCRSHRLTPARSRGPHGRLRLRLGALGVAVVVLFMLLVLRLWALQVLNTRTFVAQAASNHEKQVIVRAPRGEILDDKGRVLVRNRVAYELELDPGAVRDTARRHQLLLRVARMLDLPAAPAVGAGRSPVAHRPRRARDARDRHRREAEVVPAGESGDLPRALGGAGAAALLPLPDARRAHLRTALARSGPRSSRIRASTTTTAAT